MIKFAQGQRWISDSESDLGLGTVIAIEGRMVTLLFPASDETRLYAMAEAPLTRVQFNPGDTVKSAHGFSVVIDRVEESHNTLIYHGHRTDNGDEVALREMFSRKIGCLPAKSTVLIGSRFVIIHGNTCTNSSRIHCVV